MEVLLQVLYGVLEVLTLQAALPEHFQCAFQLTLHLAQLQMSYLVLLVCKLGRWEKEERKGRSEKEKGENESKWDLLEPLGRKHFPVSSLKPYFNTIR